VVRPYFKFQMFASQTTPIEHCCPPPHPFWAFTVAASYGSYRWWSL